MSTGGGVMLGRRGAEWGGVGWGGVTRSTTINQSSFISTHTVQRCPLPRESRRHEHSRALKVPWGGRTWGRPVLDTPSAGGPSNRLRYCGAAANMTLPMATSSAMTAPVSGLQQQQVAGRQRGRGGVPQAGAAQPAHGPGHALLRIAFLV